MNRVSGRRLNTLPTRPSRGHRDRCSRSAGSCRKNRGCVPARRGCGLCSETYRSRRWRSGIPTGGRPYDGGRPGRPNPAETRLAGIQWREESRDTFKAGEPATAVRGIATTGMATFDVLKRAAASGRNFVVTHEPTFYNDKDLVTGLEADRTYLAKQRFIAANGLIVWRFHDHAHAMRPDPLIAGSARALGWGAYASAGNQRLYVLPPTTLRALATDVARRLNDRGLRSSAIRRCASPGSPWGQVTASRRSRPTSTSRSAEKRLRQAATRSMRSTPPPRQAEGDHHSRTPDVRGPWHAGSC